MTEELESVDKDNKSVNYCILYTQVTKEYREYVKKTWNT